MGNRFVKPKAIRSISDNEFDLLKRTSSFDFHPKINFDNNIKAKNISIEEKRKQIAKEFDELWKSLNSEAVAVKLNKDKLHYGNITIPKHHYMV